MERFKEIIVTWQGFWYRRYEEDLNRREVRISPKSYRYGYHNGCVVGFTLCFVLCLMIVSLVISVGI